MNFTVSESKRRANSMRLMVSTAGGKIAVVAVLALFTAAAASPLYVPSLVDLFYGGDAAGYAARAASIGAGYVAEEVAALEGAMAVGVPAFWVVMALVAVACIFRQRNVHGAMRKEESLSLEGNVLTYSFHASGDIHSAVSRNVVMIDLGASRVSFDAKQRCWLFEGGVHAHYYRIPGGERLLSMREMEAVDRYAIGAHFDDPFDEIMSSYANG